MQLPHPELVQPYDQPRQVELVAVLDLDGERSAPLDLALGDESPNAALSAWTSASVGSAFSRNTSRLPTHRSEW